MTGSDAPRPDRALARMLAAHGLERLGPVLAEHGIDAEILGDLTDDDLREMGLSIGDRKRLARLQEMVERGEETPSGASPSRSRSSGPERRQMTVLFADLVGSTSLSVKLDPEDLRSLIRAYHTVVESAVSQYGGHVAQHLGDGAVVYFGWPTAHENDAERAVRAALDVVDRVAKLKTPSSHPMATRVGVATGQVVVGDLVENVESRERPVIGETPNLAARLEGLAPPGGVVISDTTRRMVGDLFELTDLGMQELKGFDVPVRVWQVEGESAAASRFRAIRSGAISPLVGRDLETTVLEKAWRSTVEGHGRVAHLIGDAGLGKSRLVRWMREFVVEANGSEQVFFCSPYHVGSAFFPLVRHLEAAADIGGQDDSEARWQKLQTLVERDGLSTARDLPVLAKLLQIAVPEGVNPPRLEPIQEKEIVLSAAVARLLNAADNAPVLLVLEDLHWVDPTTNELIERMLRAGGERPIMTLACYRPEFQPSWPTDGHVALELGRLAPTSCKQLVASLMGDEGLDDELVSRIISRTDGVPLFVEELTKAMLETGLGATSIRNMRRGETLDQAIPETLHDSLLARLDRLGDVKHVAQVAACMGREFTRSLVLRVSDLDGPALDAALARLLESNLVQLEHGPNGIMYVFKHALVQDAAYQSLLRSTRISIHTRIASTLEADETLDAPPEILAYHFGRAGLFEKEADYWLQAGQRALATTAFLEAIQHFTSGLAALERLQEADPARELAFRVHLAVPLTLTRGWAADEVGAAYQRAHELCRILGESPETFPTLVGVFTYHLVRGEFGLAYDLAISNEAVAEESGDPELIMEAAHDRGTSAFYRGRLDEAVPHLRRAAELYRTDEHQHHALLYSKLPGPTAMVHEAMSYASQGLAREAVEMCRKARALADEGDHAFTRVWTMTGECIVLQHLRDVETLLPVAMAMIEESKELGFPNWLAQGLAWAGWARAASGEVEDGVAMIRQGLEIWTMTGAILMRPFLTAMLVDALRMSGELDDAETTYLEVVELMEKTGELWCAAEVHRLGAEIARARLGPDDPLVEARVAAALDAATEIGSRLHALNVTADVARSLVAAGRADEARATLEPHLQAFPDRSAPVFQQAEEILREASA